MPAVVVAVAAVVAYGAGYYLAAAALFAYSISRLNDVDIPEFGADTSHQELKTAAASRRTRVYGETVVSGPIVKYQKISIGGKEYQHFFTPLANHVCESVNLYQLDGKPKSNMVGSGYRLMARLGTQTTVMATALAEMTNIDNTFVGFGITDVYHRYVIDPDMFPGGVTDVKFLVKGAKIYDPRKDSTQGGTGSHRHDDPNTWDWTDNAALINFDWKRFYGDIDLDLSLFDLSNIAAEANLCDESVDYIDKDGEIQQEKRYICNGVVDLSVKPKTVEQSLLACCAGKWIFSGGKYYLTVGAYRGPATVTINESDLTGAVKRISSTPLEDRCNAVTSTFISKNLFYQATDSTPVVSTFYKNGRDKGRYLEHDRSFNFVQSDTHAQRLNRQYMEFLAAGDTLNLSVGWIGLKCAKGTTVNINLPSIDIVGKEYEIIENDYDITEQSWKLTVRETAPTIYDDSVIPAETDLTPNTDIDNTVVAAVTGIDYTPTPNDSYRQGYLTWSNPVPDSVVRHTVTVYNTSAEIVKTLTPVNPQVDIEGLAVGDYTVTIAPINRFGKKPATLTPYALQIGLVVTPIAAPTVTSKPGFITIEPLTPLANNATYEWRWHTSSDATVIAGGRDRVKTITPVIADVTYTIQYRLITETGAGEWLSVDVNGIERTVYTWIVYADDDEGTGLSLSPIGKSFYGIATGMPTGTISLADPDIFDYYPQPAGGGTPTINAYLSNDPHVVSTASDGTGGTYPVSTTLSVLIGAVDDTAAYTIGASASAGVTGSLSGSTYTITNLTADTGTVTFTATRVDYPTMVKVFSISKVKAGTDGATGPQGVPGTNGTNGVTTYTWIRYGTASNGGTSSNDPTGKTYIGFAYNKTSPTESTNNADYTWSLIQGPQGNTGVAGTPGADGTPRYTWIKYGTSAAGAGLTDTPSGSTTYIGIATNKTSASESSTPGDYVWSRFKGEDGPQGVAGSPGADGVTTYTWIRYGTASNGGTSSNDPTGKTYIGFAYNKTSPTESTNNADYTWSLIQGPQGNTGVAGTPGADGTPRYTWIKYGTSAAGAGLTDTPSGSTTYIGIATNKTSASESSTPGDYTWSLFKGEDGEEGPPGPIGPSGPAGPVGTLDFYQDSGVVSNLPFDDWVTICSINAPVGTFDVVMEMTGSGKNLPVAFQLDARYTKAGVVIRSDSSSSKFPSVSMSSSGTVTYTSITSLSVQIKSSAIAEVTQGEAYITLTESP